MFREGAGRTVLYMLLFRVEKPTWWICCWTSELMGVVGTQRDRVLWISCHQTALWGLHCRKEVCYRQPDSHVHVTQTQKKALKLHPLSPPLPAQVPALCLSSAASVSVEVWEGAVSTEPPASSFLTVSQTSSSTNETPCLCAQLLLQSFTFLPWQVKKTSTFRKWDSFLSASWFDYNTFLYHLYLHDSTLILCLHMCKVAYIWRWMQAGFAFLCFLVLSRSCLWIFHHAIMVFKGNLLIKKDKLPKALGGTRMSNMTDNEWPPVMSRESHQFFKSVKVCLWFSCISFHTYTYY